MFKTKKQTSILLTCLPFSLYLRHGFCFESQQPGWNRVNIDLKLPICPLIKERIVMSALYWGVEVRERKLRDAIASNLSEKPNLRVKILLDWCRGTRLNYLRLQLIRGSMILWLLSGQLSTQFTGLCVVF